VSDVRFVLNVDAELVQLALQYAYLAERGAEFVAEEIAGSIEISEYPAGLGEPPHSTGPYKESWKSGKARRKRDYVVAYGFSMAKTASGESLGRILDEGRGAINPHPHVNAGIARARRRLGVEVEQVNARLRGGAHA
jgi:hypothetical protein